MCRPMASSLMRWIDTVRRLLHRRTVLVTSATTASWSSAATSVFAPSGTASPVTADAGDRWTRGRARPGRVDTNRGRLELRYSPVPKVVLLMREIGTDRLYEAVYEICPAPRRPTTRNHEDQACVGHSVQQASRSQAEYPSSHLSLGRHR
jgi:hypothetical protein